MRSPIAETFSAEKAAADDRAEAANGGSARDREHEKAFEADQRAARPIIAALRGVAECAAGRGYEARWYLFGSATKSIARAKDVDLLVVCESEQTALAVRHELRELCLRLPLHLLLLTHAEEGELGFVGSQGCVAIYP